MAAVKKLVSCLSNCNIPILSLDLTTHSYYHIMYSLVRLKLLYFLRLTVFFFVKLYDFLSM